MVQGENGKILDLSDMDILKKELSKKEKIFNYMELIFLILQLSKLKEIR